MIKSSAVTGTKIADGTVEAIDLANNAVTSANFAILKNTISNSTNSNGIYIYVLGGGTARDFDISRNMISGNADRGVFVVVEDGSADDFIISDEPI